MNKRTNKRHLLYPAFRFYPSLYSWICPAKQLLNDMHQSLFSGLGARSPKLSGTARVSSTALARCPPNPTWPFATWNCAMRRSTSGRKCLMRPWIGQAAASPSAHIVRPSICFLKQTIRVWILTLQNQEARTYVSSRSISISRGWARPSTNRSIILAIHVVPSRHGVHCPHDSCL